MTWTQVECPFEKDKKIQSYLLTAPIYSEEGEGHLPTLARSQSPPPQAALSGLLFSCYAGEAHSQG